MAIDELFLPLRRIEPVLPEEQALAWPYVLPPVRQLLHEGLELGEASVIVGENGSGKSTLVEAIAMAYGMNPEGGSTGAMNTSRRSESGLHAQLKLHRGAAASRKGFFLRAETMHNFYTYLEASKFETMLHERSHGESFLDLIAERIPHIKGLWIFDEPESALSLGGCVRLLRLMKQLRELGSQIILSTHSPVLAVLPGANIWEVGDWGMRQTPYDQLELVRDWRACMADPRQFIDDYPG
ncbi:AAA family ATPase [Glutamicibacter sp.]|uniref:AAA family ATPase n=1 Tax=Glutamicibacter sp. TaxID=1931995 RepID=UPI0028BDCA10|nr:AAA family ATPase [Glutamicibacter sp.]